MTYVWLSQREIILRASEESPSFVPSKPGVSTKHRSNPGNESLMTEILVVKDAKSCPANPVTPVAFSMNYIGMSKFLA